MPAGPSKISKTIDSSSKSISTIYPAYCHDVSPTLPQWCPLRGADIHALKDVGMLVPEVPGSQKVYRLHHYGNHPMKFVKVVGVVVAVDEFTGRRIYTIDDSSGACVECSCVVPIITPTDALAGKGIPGHLNQGGPQLDIDAAVAKTRKDTRKKVGAEVTTNAKSPDHGVESPNVPWGSIDVGTVIKVKGRVGSFRDMIQVEVVSAFVVKGTDFEVKFWNDAMKFREEILGREWVLQGELVEILKKVAERRRKRDFKKGREKDVGQSDIVSRVKDHGEGVFKDKRKRPVGDMDEDGDRDAAKRLVEKEMRARARKEVAERKRLEEEARGKREAARLDEQRRRKRRELEAARNRIRYPSLAVRKAAAGKYDLLGI